MERRNEMELTKLQQATINRLFYKGEFCKFLYKEDSGALYISVIEKGNLFVVGVSIHGNLFDKSFMFPCEDD